MNTSIPFEDFTIPFLKRLANVPDIGEKTFWFETLDDKGKEASLHKWAFKTFEQAERTLTALNKRGAGVFVCVNQTDGKARTKASIVGLNAWYVDIDLDKAQERLSIDELLKKLPLTPSMYVETPGGYHLYWLMLEAPIMCNDAGKQAYESELKRVQTFLSRYGTDRACVDANRLLRLPGFFHNKQQPRMVKFHDCGDLRYTRDEFLAAFSNNPKPAEQANLQGSYQRKPKPPSRSQILQRAARYLEKCPPAIQGQNGSKTCFETALKIQDGFDLSQDEALILMWEHYNPRCEPPWSEKELRHKIADAASKCTNRGHLINNNATFDESREKKRGRPKKEAKEARENKLNQVVTWILSKAELFNDGNSGYATTLGDIQTTHRLDTDLFEAWLSSQFYIEFGIILKSSEKIDVLAMLKARAMHDSPEHPVFTRIARDNEAVYIDLCDAGRKQARVTKQGWGVIEAKDSPVKFQRYPGMKALPVPMPKGSINRLRDFLNVNDQHYVLCVSWLVQALYGGKSFPVLVINGVQGTGKTTASRTLRSLIDPSDVPDSGSPRNEADAVLAASRSWIQCWDNLSVVTNDLSDLICRLATGAGFRTRKLFSNSEEHFVSIARPIIMNGIPELLRREDLADRALPVKLLPLGNNRKTEDDYWTRFEYEKPKIVGALLDILAGVLRELPGTAIHAQPKPRMLGYAHLGVAVEKVCGWGHGSFLQAYEDTRTEAAHAVLEGSTVAQALVSLAEDIPSGSALSGREIRKRLMEIAKRDGLDCNDKAFYNDRVFKNAADRLNPALMRCYGMTLKWFHTMKGNEYRIYRAEKPGPRQ